jgi:hypothetical protein
VRTPILILFLSFFLLNFTSEAQQVTLSEAAEISILTIGPGSSLNDAFGHNAFRVQDPTIGIDIIYDYGRYDFETPNFYLKFAQGKLLYEMGSNNFLPFLNYYERQDRWIKEQVIALRTEEKIELFRFLQNNARPENKKYKYDFFYDNCATRIRDVLTTSLDEKVKYTPDFITESKTFRELIRQNVYANSWGSLGMDVAIGSVTDVEATAWQYQFLPEYVFEAAAVATIDRNGQEIPLIKETRVLYQNKSATAAPNFFTSPLFVFGLLGILILWRTFRDKKNRTRSRYLDSILFFVTGLIGIFLILLWFATDHSATANNYNVLWAFPFSILFFIAIGKKKPKKWLHRYVIFLVLLLVLMVLHSLTGVQQFAIAFIPLFIALAVRYLYVISYLKRQNLETATET